jgi:predicted nucleotidyltransferase
MRRSRRVGDKMATPDASCRPEKDAAMNSPTLDPDTERAVQRFMHRMRQRYDVAGGMLFGSRARQTHRADSDADVLVLLRGAHTRFLPTKLAMADDAFDVLLETGVNISPLPVWLDEWEHPDTWSNPALLRTIAREGIRL